MLTLVVFSHLLLPVFCFLFLTSYFLTQHAFYCISPHTRIIFFSLWLIFSLSLCLQIFNLMKFDSYSRFLKSSLYQECMRAEVDGQPLPDPYQIPCSPAPSKHSASSDRSTLSTPKKVPLKIWTVVKGLIMEICDCLWIHVSVHIVCLLSCRRPESKNQGGHWMRTAKMRALTRNVASSSRGLATGALEKVQRRRKLETLTSVRN